jgi:hypothetical protein
MTLRQLHDYMPEATEIARGNIERGMDHLEELALQADEKDLPEIEQVRVRLNSIIGAVDDTCRRIQSNIKLLSAQCREDWEAKDDN